jgi:hypothetical protein
MILVSYLQFTDPGFCSGTGVIVNKNSFNAKRESV